MAAHIGVEVNVDLARGDARSAVPEWAKDNNVDLIVMGSVGLDGAALMVLGSVAEAVTRKSPCPILITHKQLPEKRKTKFSRVLCAADLTDLTERVVSVAQAVCDEAGEIEVLHALPIPHVSIMQEALTGIESEWHKAVEDARGSAAGKLEALEEKLSDSRISTYLAEGKASREILERHNEKKADLLVVGAHDKKDTDVADRVLGSTAERLLHGADVPVLVVPHE